MSTEPTLIPVEHITWNNPHITTIIRREPVKRDTDCRQAVIRRQNRAGVR